MKFELCWSKVLMALENPLLEQAVPMLVSRQGQFRSWAADLYCRIRRVQVGGHPRSLLAETGWKCNADVVPSSMVLQIQMSATDAEIQLEHTRKMRVLVMALPLHTPSTCIFSWSAPLSGREDRHDGPKLSK
ncbi:hypothetical protein B2J93_5487 [Marssonina coronariae]|uniref:Uncharacterized protein n=1 Tax=Diplocarpon coronariae TaxID=2795749 RepID=A0A218YZH7_9HELO|nr:hypothetical protein B2J93_5487 [Marssonina coronariae]